VLWSFVYFFSLLCSYYILRPVRDEMGVQSGVDQMQWLFTGTFIAMLLLVPVYGALVARIPRARLLPLVYGFFILNLVAFYFIFDLVPGRGVARAFFIWVSVFNLFVVSVFWSFMTDIFSNIRARRLFGLIAAGGSAGAIVGPALTVATVKPLGVHNLLWVSAGFLALALVCVLRLSAWARDNHTTDISQSRRDGAATGGNALAGLTKVARSPYLIGITLFVLLFTVLATFLYITQAQLVRNAFSDSGQRTAVFATIDLIVNVLTISLQVFVTGHVLSRLGLPVALMLVPFLLITGFVGLGLFPLLYLLLTLQVLRRAGNYAVTRPAREVLFTVVDREDRYKAKSFIDTVVYRGGDTIGAWVHAGLVSLGLSVSGVAAVAVPVALCWLATAWWLGRTHDRLLGREAAPVPGGSTRTVTGATEI